MSEHIQPIDIRHEAEKLGLTPVYFANIHSRSLQRIYDAYNGKAPTLLLKMNKHIKIVKARKKISKNKKITN